METIEYKNHKINIEQDQDPQNPRDDDNLGTMVCFHGRYNLGDKDHGLTSDQFKGWEGLKEYLGQELNAYVILPIFMYDHSGITIRTTPFSCQWDSGQIGFIYATCDKIKEEFDTMEITQAKIQKYLESEINAYDQYLTGDVYGFQIEGELCSHSCWGFFGSDHEASGLLTIAESEINWGIYYDLEKHGEQLSLEI